MGDQLTILRISSSTIYAGFAGNYKPVCIENYEKPLYKDGAFVTLNNTRNVLSLELKRIFIDKLLTDPESQRVVVLEDVLWSSPLKSIIAQTIINDLKAKSVSFIPEPLCLAISAGARCALVVQVGWSESKVLPIYDLRALMGSYALSTTRGFGSMHETSSEPFDASPNHLSRAIDSLTVAHSLKEQNQKLAESGELNVPVLEESAWWQLFFDTNRLNDDEEQSIVQLVSRSLDMLELDVRAAAERNVILVSDITSITIPGAIRRHLVETLKEKFPKVRLISSLGTFAGCSIYLSSVQAAKSTGALFGEILREGS